MRKNKQKTTTTHFYWQVTQLNFAFAQFVLLTLRVLLSITVILKEPKTCIVTPKQDRKKLISIHSRRMTLALVLRDVS